MAATAAAPARAVSSHASAAEDLSAYMLGLGTRARDASGTLAGASTEAKNAALVAIADSIGDRTEAIKSANRRDLDAGRSSGLAAPLLDRLELTDARIRSMAEGLRQIAALPDPVGEITDLRMRPSGLQIGRMRVPLGVIGIIYESRPNVTADAAALCMKSGNATILRGGSEALTSNLAIAECIHDGLAAAGLPGDGVQVVETSDRAAVGMLIAMDAHVDVIVPRGGRGLIERISRDARVPVIKHLDGNCHVFIDEHADLDMAITVAVNAKTYRYGICGAMENPARRPLRRSPRASGPGRTVRRGRGRDPRLRGDEGLGGRRGRGDPRKTGRRSSSRRFLRCGWSAALTRRWRTSAVTARATPTPS